MTIKLPALFAAVLASMALAGCATSTEDARHRQHHPATATASTTATASSGMHQGHMEMMHDPKAMCEMHKKMMSGKTPEEQKAMMDERMKSMSPEMMKKHHAMMAECK